MNFKGPDTDTVIYLFIYLFIFLKETIAVKEENGRKRTEKMMMMMRRRKRRKVCLTNSYVQPTHTRVL